MKKLKFVLGALALLLAGSMVLTGCDPNGGNGGNGGSVASYEISDKAYIVYDLPAKVAANDKVTIEVTGENKGETGFRLYLIKDSSDQSLSNIYTGFKAEGEDYATGEFSISCELEAASDASQLMIKGPAWGTNIDDVVIKSVKANGTAIDVSKVAAEK